MLEINLAVFEVLVPSAECSVDDTRRAPVSATSWRAEPSTRTSVLAVCFGDVKRLSVSVMNSAANVVRPKGGCHDMRPVQSSNQCTTRRIYITDAWNT